MTVDDLVEAYQDAFAKNELEQQRMGDGCEYMDAHRAGVVAIVRALRDELSKCDWDEGENMIDALDAILGDAGEKVAGGSTREDERKDNGCLTPAGPKPATDAAPAVCVWKPISLFADIEHYSTKHGVKNRMHLYRGGDVCPYCLAPIKFTEAK